MSSKKIIIAVFLISTFAASAFSAHLTWSKVNVSDTDGYMIHYGNASGKYEVVIDVGNVAGYDVQGLEMDKSYFFSLTAYDKWGNHSVYSSEVVYSPGDVEAPELVSVEVSGNRAVKMIFSEMLDKTSAEEQSHYVIFPNVGILGASLQEDGRTVILNTDIQTAGNYLVTVSHVTDAASNEIAMNTGLAYRVETTEVSSEFSGPAEFNLGQNYPNPFNPSTTISYSVKKAGHVRLLVFNIRGEIVRVLLDEEASAGQQSPVSWDGSNTFGRQVSSGMYFYRLESGGQIETRRMQLVR